MPCALKGAHSHQMCLVWLLPVKSLASKLSYPSAHGAGAALLLRPCLMADVFCILWQSCTVLVCAQGIPDNRGGHSVLRGAVPDSGGEAWALQHRQ